MDILLAIRAIRVRMPHCELKWEIPIILRFTVDNHEMVVFSDGRAILRNTTDESLARGLYAKYIGA